MEIAALHGNLGACQDWGALALEGLRAIDLWEHSSLSYFEFAHELATELTSGMGSPVLAGYSLGGRLSLYAMAIHPERWSGAVIVSAHPGLCCVEDRLARRVSDEIWAEQARTLPWGEFLEKWDSQMVLADSPSVHDRSHLEAKRDSIALAFETWTLGRQEDLRKSLRQFHAPVLWVTGEEDEKFTALASEMSGIFENFEHFKVENCGHRVLLEQPEVLSRKIKAFSESIR
ncbi:alpha/beta fold hydrolase [Verrucomicrobiales bacterium]|nr:alpha/beta fold hydrolase [Verrucomicrobiales bacterium]MDB4358866.1 alpha/beta fold hydrolase [Verrucomicrobiales bacterium]